MDSATVDEHNTGDVRHQNSVLHDGCAPEG